MAGTATISAGETIKVEPPGAATRPQRTPPSPERPPRRAKALPRRKAAEPSGPPAPLAHEPGPVDASPAPCPPVNQALHDLVRRANEGDPASLAGLRKLLDE